MRYPCRTTLLVLTAVVLLTGCSTSQLFQLQLTVVNKSDGKPVPDAHVVLDTMGLEGRKLDMNYGWPNERTDTQGRFVHELRISPYPSERPFWYLKVSKEGFEPLVIDFKPKQQPPKNSETAYPLVLTVELQPTAKPLR